MLTDYDTYQQNAPYYSDPNNVPGYQKAQRSNKAAVTGLHVGQGLAPLLSLIPFVGPALSAGAEAGLAGGLVAQQAKWNHQSTEFHQQWLNQLPGHGTNNTAAKTPMDESKLGAFGSFLNKDSVSGIQKLISNNKATSATKAFSNNAFAQDAVNNPVDTSQFNTDPNAYGSDSSSPVSGVGTGQTIETTPSSGNMDWSSIGTGSGDLGTDAGGLASFKKGGSIVVGDDGVKLKYMDGGKLKYFGGGESKAGGEGGTKDNIALVNTDTGKDTGVRVSKGEMLVVSKENLESLHKAIKKKDHKGVFSIMKNQVEQAPRVQDGTHGFAGGGMGNSGGEIDIDKELANIDKQIADLHKQANDKKVSETEKEKAASRLTQLNVLRGQYQEAAQAYKGIANSSLLSKEEILTRQKGFLSDMKKANDKVTELTGSTLSKNNTIADGTAYTSKDGTSVKYDAKSGKWFNTEGGKDIAKNTEVGNSQDITREYLQNRTPGQPISATYTNELAKTDTPATTSNLPEHKYPPATDLDVSYKFAQPKIPTSDIPSMTAPADYRGGALDPTVPQKVPTDNTTFPAQDPNKPFDYRHGMDIAGDVLGTGFDIGRGIAGWNAANKPLPKWQVPPSWSEYGNRLKGMSTEGLTAAEMANYQRQIGQGYAYDTANIRDVSGGNSGQVLGNLGRAAGQFYGAQGQVAGLDAGLHRQNMAAYGSWLGNDVNLSRLKFNDRYQEDYQNKISGAQLANDAITNIKNRVDFNRQYGQGSDYSQLMGLQKDNLAETNDILKQNKNYYLTHPDAFKPASVGSSASDGSGDGTFADYLAWKKTQNK